MGYRPRRDREAVTGSRVSSTRSSAEYSSASASSSGSSSTYSSSRSSSSPCTFLVTERATGLSDRLTGVAENGGRGLREALNPDGDRRGDDEDGGSGGGLLSRGFSALKEKVQNVFAERAPVAASRARRER
jgi:hypothetical protein